MLNIKHLTIYIALAVMSFASLAQSQDLMGFDRASYGSVVLSQTQSAGTDVQLELSIGNYENEPIINYSVGSVFAQIGRSVGRLDVLTDKGMFPCTAFIVSKQYILTNYHCSLGLLDNEKIGATRIDATQFVAGYTQTGIDEGTKKYTVIPTPVETSKSLDYAVLEVIGDPSQEYGQLKLSSILPNSGDPFWIIGHPMGEGQRISREKCKANNPALSSGKLLHTCDTLPGNSGSPVIDAGLQQVVALHHAGSKADSVNFAILMSEILANSKVLTAYRAPDTVQQVTPKAAGTTACDALYSAASEAKACFAYEAYFKSCRDHTLAPIADGYIKEFCQVQGVVEAEEAPEKTEATQIPSTAFQRCSNDLSGCSEDDLCKTATYIRASKGPTWLGDTNNSVKEAKKRGLSCGVVEIVVTNFKQAFLSQSKLNRQQLQYALKNLGYYSYGIDGLWGKGTSAGFDQFVNSNRLRVKTEAQVFSSLLSKVNVPSSFKPDPIRIAANWNFDINCSGRKILGAAIFENSKIVSGKTQYSLYYANDRGGRYRGRLEIVGTKFEFRMKMVDRDVSGTGSGKFSSSYRRAEGTTSDNCSFVASPG